ncbi:MAG: PIN domain-containing protein [Nitrososphaerales archaeon]
MTAIIDASALVAFCLNKDGRDIDKIAQILTSGAINPDLFVTESANAILVSLKRGLIDEKT